MTDTATSNLMGDWFDLCHRARVRLVDATAMADELVAAYGEPQRHYHTLRHVHACLQGAANIEMDPDDRIVVELALWFHDVVYDPTRSDNEARSADRARAWVADAVRNPLGRAGEVADLVLMTAGHTLEPAADDLTRIVHDVDLAILGAHPDLYVTYAEQIRREYRHLDDATFATGRRRVLESLLATTPLFALPGFRAQIEPQARRNMEDELGRL